MRDTRTAPDPLCSASRSTRRLIHPRFIFIVAAIMPEKTVGIALLGCGVVGGGVASILSQQAPMLRRRAGLNLVIRHVVVKDPAKPNRAYTGPVTTDALAAINDAAVDIVVELIGGTGIANDYMQAALRAGKPIVTANKSLLAARGPELFKLAREHHTCIAFEASCGGGIPIIEALTHGLAANRIDAVVGIVNGTCNFILTQMTRNNWSYTQAVAEAQKLGFAEADPTLDVSGRDAAQKLAIIAGLAFNVYVTEADIFIEGIDRLTDVDIRLAGELGYVIKLLAIGERVGPDGTKLALRVHPALVRNDDLLADVSGSFNAVSVFGHALGHSLFYGRGAGAMPTASAVVADIMNVALGVTALAQQQMAIYPDSLPRASVQPITDLSSRYYLRLLARDEPGVLAQITTLLGKRDISLASIMQHETNRGQFVPIVISTHLAREGAVRKALELIDGLSSVQGPAVCLRIIDQPREFAEHGN